jgi:hypothetical protein
MAAAFQPPPPFTLEAHFDAVTGGKYTSARLGQVGRAYQVEINGALTAIAARPGYQERAALLQVLHARLKAWGKLRGLVKERASESSDDVVTLFARIIVEDALGLPLNDVLHNGKGLPTPSALPRNVARRVDNHLNTPVASKVQGIAKDQLAKGLTMLLVEQAGKDVAEGIVGHVKFLKMVRGAVLADSPEASLREVTAYLGPKGAAWVAGNIDKVPGVELVRSLRFVKLTTRLVRVVNVRLALAVRLVNSMKWLGPVVTTLDLLLASDDVGRSDAEEDLASYLELVAQVTNQQADLTSAFYARCGPKLPAVSLQTFSTLPAIRPRLGL